MVCTLPAWRVSLAWCACLNCRYLGMDPEADEALLHIAEWALTAPVPEVRGPPALCLLVYGAYVQGGGT